MEINKACFCICTDDYEDKGFDMEHEISVELALSLSIGDTIWIGEKTRTKFKLPDSVDDAPYRVQGRFFDMDTGLLGVTIQSE